MDPGAAVELSLECTVGGEADKGKEEGLKILKYDSLVLITHI